MKYDDIVNLFDAEVANFVLMNFSNILGRYCRISMDRLSTRSVASQSAGLAPPKY